ncbi:hypothetical protein IRJ41_012632 [Triplophysa rosa]|uniref:Rho RNA-BD domain-containing protein n=1 Tax=Triplophysa rosa TaxID=992332 RepID=A0A9W7T7P4_TRIRA|nr:hypothetical protein IRJ41_012632 [Triplophysa rosa]
MNIQELESKKHSELLSLIQELGIEKSSTLSKKDLIFTIIRDKLKNDETVEVTGVIEILQDGFGFIRSSKSNYLPSMNDIYVSPQKIKCYGLITGDTVFGEIKDIQNDEKYFSLLKVNKINFEDIDKSKNRIGFDSLVPLYPEKRIQMEIVGTKNITGRVIDIVSPIGKGQRALIVSPPRAGKTIMLQSIANSIAANHPEIHLIVLLIDERPEEVTDMIRSVKGEVISSTFDEPCYRHIQVAEIALEKAKRLTEYGKDVVILLDSITRLARAYNSTIPSSGKILTGGVDANALQCPKRFLGAARNTEDGGSLSIIATALIDTGSKMDEVIFEEFKGTGNSEIVIDRKLADKRVFPAIDILKSGTRREEFLVNDEILQKTWVLHKILSSMGTVEGRLWIKLKFGKSF